MSDTFDTTDRSRLQLFGARGNYRKDDVFAMIDGSLYGTVAYTIGDQPFATPTMIWRQGDYIYWHGSAGSRMLKTVAQGAPVCVTFVHVDGFVLSRLASAHAMNYRSTMVFGNPEPVTSLAERRAQLQFFLERLFPGRWSEVKQPSEAELTGIIMVRMKIDEGSLKRRAGAPGDGRPVFGGEKLYEQICWAGVVPIETHIGPGQPAPRLKADLETPEYLESFARRFGYASAPADTSAKPAVRVVATTDLTPQIRLIRLESADGSAFPAPTPGAHINLQVTAADGTVDLRQYTLTDWDPAGAWLEIAVLREDQGKGGSRFIHAVMKPGHVLGMGAISNDFALNDDASCPMLIAGGIGITPIIAMARGLRRAKKGFKLHYSFRGAESAAFLAELQELAEQNLHLHDTSRPGGRMDLAKVLAEHLDHVYVCGPRGLIDAVEQTAAAIGLDPSLVHRETFKLPEPISTDKPVPVTLQRSGKSFIAEPGRSIMDQIHDLGVPTPHSCKRGECGLCATRVLGGSPIHRDHFFKPAEQGANSQMCICVSWAEAEGVSLDI